MRYLLFIFSICLLACNSSSPKDENYESRHSTAFNHSVDSLINTYSRLSEAFVNWDSAKIPSISNDLDKRFQELNLGELDSSLTSTATESITHSRVSLQELAGSASLEFKRHSFDRLTQNLYDLLRGIQYDSRKLYLQECPMAFTVEGKGTWLTGSGKDSIRNPYLGKYHPKYGDGMLECGENKSTLDFQKK